jgi:hypothetical protein
MTHKCIEKKLWAKSTLDYNTPRTLFETISAGSLIPAKTISVGHWPRWNDPAEIQNRRFGPTTFFKGNIPQNFFIVKYPHAIPFFNFNQKKLGRLRLHFLFQWGQWPRWNRFWRISKRIFWRIRRHMRNGVSPWIMALDGVDWWKNRGSKISCNCPFKGTVSRYFLPSVFHK